MLPPQGESGPEPILPPEELEAMYRRILERQIMPPDAGEDSPAAGGGERLQQRRLAATMGLTLRQDPKYRPCTLRAAYRCAYKGLGPGAA